VKHFLWAAFLLASCSKAGDPDIQIADAWARETVSAETAAYMTIRNAGAGDDRLVGVTAPAPAKAMLHASESSGGISRMREMGSGLAVPAGASVELKPGGSHVMITGLAAPLPEGAQLDLRLKFEKSGERRVVVPAAAAVR
jgi:periplasmic copper chaperone A